MMFFSRSITASTPTRRGRGDVQMVISCENNVTVNGS